MDRKCARSTPPHPVQPNTKHRVHMCYNKNYIDLCVQNTKSLRSKWRRVEIWKTFWEALMWDFVHKDFVFWTHSFCCNTYEHNVWYLVIQGAPKTTIVALFTVYSHKCPFTAYSFTRRPFTAYSAATFTVLQVKILAFTGYRLEICPFTAYGIRYNHPSLN